MTGEEDRVFYLEKFIIAFLGNPDGLFVRDPNFSIVLYLKSETLDFYFC